MLQVEWKMLELKVVTCSTSEDNISFLFAAE
jgi:hypothetical protein